MAKAIGHFTMWIPMHKNQCFSTKLLLSLTCVLFISGITLPVCNAQNDTTVKPALANLQGICDIDKLPDPCEIGATYGDPGDCTVYYECTTGTNVLGLHKCETGKKYDYKKKKCRADRANLKRPIRCTPACDDKKTKENVPTVPVLKTEKTITKRSENATLEAIQSITEPNEAITTDDDDTIKAAGSFGKDNDTVVPAVDPNQGAGFPGGAANTTAVDTAEETEAQTEGEDVITTATTSPSTPSSTPSPTPPPTPSPSTKSTTKSTTTTQPGVVVVETDGDPGYDIVSTAPNNSSGAVGGVDESKDSVSTAHIGIAVGIILAILIVSVVVFLLICHIRKKKYSKEKQIVSIENPKYKQAGGDKHAYRFSRDASLLVNENFFQEKPANNNSTEKLAFIPGRKRPAPSTPSKDKSKESKEKRKAPPPPNPFTGEIEDDDFRPPTFRRDSSDLYERDTDGSAEEMELSTFSAPTSSFGTGTGTFGKGKNFGNDTPSKTKGTPNGRLQPQPSTRSTDYSSEEDDSDEEDEDENLLGRKYKSTDIDDAVFKDDAQKNDVNNSMDAYLSAYDQALK